MKSSSSAINILLETKKEYTTEVVKILSPFMIRFYESLYRDVCKQNKMTKYLLKEFQIELKQVSSMSEEKKMSLYEIIKEKYEWIDTLIRSIFVIRGQLITAMNHKNKSLHIKPIAPVEFIYKCYLEFARELWKQPNIYYHKLSISERQKNIHNLRKLAEHCIHEVIRGSMPFKDILPFVQINAIETSDDYTKVYYNEDHDNEYESDDEDEEEYTDEGNDDTSDDGAEVSDDEEQDEEDEDVAEDEEALEVNEKVKEEVEDGDETLGVNEKVKEDVEDKQKDLINEELESHDDVIFTESVVECENISEGRDQEHSPRDAIQDEHYDADIDEVNDKVNDKVNEEVNDEANDKANDEVTVFEDARKHVDTQDEDANGETNDETNTIVLELDKKEQKEYKEEQQLASDLDDQTKVIEIDFNKRVLCIEEQQTTPVNDNDLPGEDDIKTINIDNEFF